MELKLPPAVVFLLFAGLMYLAYRVLPVGYFDFFGRSVLALLLAGFGVALGIISLWQFFRARTSIDPRDPDKASTLVTGGIFQVTRNPMYLALLLVLLSLGLYLGNAFNSITAAGFVSYMNRFQIIPEEKMLFEKFGRPYKDYCLLVRRWF